LWRYTKGIFSRVCSDFEGTVVPSVRSKENGKKKK
jgi:hypothetical protein